MVQDCLLGSLQATDVAEMHKIGRVCICRPPDPEMKMLFEGSQLGWQSRTSVIIWVKFWRLGRRVLTVHL